MLKKSSFQHKIKRQTEKQESIFTGYQNQSIEIVPKGTQILDLTNKDFKSAILDMFKELKKKN